MPAGTAHPAREGDRKTAAVRRLATALACACALLAVGAARAPEPDPVPKRWQLELEPGPLRVMAVTTGGAGGAGGGGATTGLYYYLTYTVTNNSGDDRFLAPSFELSTDTGDLGRSGKDVPLEATAAIKASLQNPLVEDQVAIIGNLLQGRENSKQGVVIWPVVDMHASQVTVYAAGFSGETAKERVHGSSTPRILRKTLMIRYRGPGDLWKQGGEPLEETERRWIMR
jgi:hypothetical protein